MELSDEFKLNVWAFGIRIRILPKKQKKYKLSDYTPKKIAKREKKRQKLEAKKAAKKAAKAEAKRKKKQEEAGLSRAERRELKRKKRESRPALTDMISLFTRITGLFFSTLFSHLHIKASKLHIKVGGPDAAQVALRWYGIYAACGGLISLLDKHSNLDGKSRADIQIVPDYLSEKIEADLKLSFSINLFGVLCVLLKVAARAIAGWIKIQPPKKPEAQTTPATQAKPSPDKEGHKI